MHDQFTKKKKVLKFLSRNLGCLWEQVGRSLVEQEVSHGLIVAPKNFHDKSEPRSRDIGLFPRTPLMCFKIVKFVEDSIINTSKLFKCCQVCHKSINEVGL